MTRLVLTIVVSLIASQACCKPFFATDFLKVCPTAEQGSTTYTTCSFYIAGFLLGSRAGKTSTPVCLPPHLSGAEATAAIIRIWHTESPAERARMLAVDPPSKAVSALLMAAYPCPPSK